VSSLLEKRSLNAPSLKMLLDSIANLYMTEIVSGLTISLARHTILSARSHERGAPWCLMMTPPFQSGTHPEDHSFA